MLAFIDPSYPITVGVFLLLLILIVLLRINTRLASLSSLKQPPGNPLKSAEITEIDEEAGSSSEIEVSSGTPFDEFLREDPLRKSLPKKEQFKAYRKWRAEKGLNWSAKD